MSEHTPGPWTAAPSKYTEGTLVVQAGMPSNRVLARFGSDAEPLDETDTANARLIAAAPDLLHVATEAYWLLAYSWQSHTFRAGPPLDMTAFAPEAREMMGKAEQDLFDALSALPAALTHATI